eukprot:347016-Chlamydomonas_euryale.AAC.11
MQHTHGCSAAGSCRTAAYTGECDGMHHTCSTRIHHTPVRAAQVPSHAPHAARTELAMQSCSMWQISTAIHVQCVPPVNVQHLYNIHAVPHPSYPTPHAQVVRQSCSLAGVLLSIAAIIRNRLDDGRPCMAVATGAPLLQTTVHGIGCRRSSAANGCAWQWPPVLLFRERLCMAGTAGAPLPRTAVHGSGQRRSSAANGCAWQWPLVLLCRKRLCMAGTAGAPLPQTAVHGSGQRRSSAANSLLFGLQAAVDRRQHGRCGGQLPQLLLNVALEGTCSKDGGQAGSRNMLSWKQRISQGDCNGWKPCLCQRRGRRHTHARARCHSRLQNVSQKGSGFRRNASLGSNSSGKKAAHRLETVHLPRRLTLNPKR